MKHSITLHQACHTSIKGVGLGFFAKPKTFERLNELQTHCRFKRPPGPPPERSEEQMPVNLGFRYVDDDYACLFRVTYPAGRDEYQRRLHFAHTLILRRDDLDQIDADIPALLAWVDAHNVFFNTENWYETHREHFPADEPDNVGEAVCHLFGRKEMLLDDLTVDCGELREWRRRQDERPLIDWLPNSVGSEERKSLAQSALAASLAPNKERRPAVWVGPDNGFDHSLFERDIVQFLFAALPYAWRRIATFSTYQRTLSSGTFLWMGSTIGGRGSFSSEQLMYEYYVVNQCDAKETSKLVKQPVNWATWTMKFLDRAPAVGMLGGADRFADNFVGSEAELFDDKQGLLDRIVVCDQALQKGKSERFDVIRTLLVKHSRPNRAQLFARLHAFCNLDRPLHEQPWLQDPHLEKSLPALTECWLGLLSKQTEELPAELCDDIIEDLVIVITFGIAYFSHASTEKLFNLLWQTASLKSLWDRLSAELFRRLGDMIGQDCSIDMIDAITDVLNEYLEAPSERATELSRFYDQVLGALCRNQQDLPQELINDAERKLWPFCEHHVPGDARGLEDTLGLLSTIRSKKGPDLVTRYLTCVLSSADTARRVWPEICTGASRQMSLQYFTELERAWNELPGSIQQVCRLPVGADLLETYWHCNPVRNVGLFEEQMVSLIDNHSLQPDRQQFAERYRSGGAARLAKSLPLRLSKQTIHAGAILRTHLTILSTVASFLPPDADEFEVHVKCAIECYIQFGFHCSSEEREDLLNQLANLLPTLGAEKHRWKLYRELALDFSKQIAAEQMQEEQVSEAADEFYEALSGHAGMEASIVKWMLIRGCQLSKQTSPQAAEDFELVVSADVICDHPGAIHKALRPPEGGETRAMPWSGFLGKQLTGNERLQKHFFNQIAGRIRTADRLEDCAFWLSEDAKNNAGWSLIKVWREPFTRILLKTIERINLKRGPKHAKWLMLARIHQTATVQEMRSQFAKPLEEAFLEFAATVDESSDAFPVDCWRELEYTVVTGLDSSDTRIRENIALVLEVGITEVVTELAPVQQLAPLAQIFESYLDVLSQHKNSTAEIQGRLNVSSVSRMAVAGSLAPPPPKRLYRWLEANTARESQERSSLFQSLACVGKRFGSVAEIHNDENRAEMTARLKVAQWLWEKWQKQPSKSAKKSFAEFLSYVGEVQQSQGPPLLKRGGSSVYGAADMTFIDHTEQGMETLGFVVATFLKERPSQVDWKDSLGQLINTKVWKETFSKTALRRKERWRAFRAVLEQELKSSDVDAKFVTKKLRLSWWNR